MWQVTNQKHKKKTINPLMDTFKTAEHPTLYSNTVKGTLAVDGWAVIFGTARIEGTGRDAAPPNSLLAVPNVTADPPTASVPTSN